MEFKAYKFRIYPTEEQESIFSKFFGAKRWIFNHYLHENKQRFMNKEKVMGNFDISSDITKLKQVEETSWLKGIDDWCLKHAAEDLSVAYSNFFNSITGKRKGPKIEAPNFKKRDSRQSYRTRGIRILDDGKVRLPKIKTPIKVIFDRNISGKRIKSSTISKTSSGKYFISILVEEENNILPSTGREVGIDLGLKDLCILSDGIKVDHPEAQLSKAKIALKKQQKILSRKTKGSKKYEKQRIKVARCHEKIVNIRNWYYHNVSRFLVDNYDAIYMEDLNVKGMMQNRKLSRKIHETSWSTLVGMISYKAGWGGRTFHQIGQFAPSSKTCSSCGHKLVDLKLSQRHWICPSCSTSHDRDLNAALNIKNFGQLDCYDQVLRSVETTDRGLFVPVSLMKFTNKIERSSDLSGVCDGIRKTTTHLD